MRVLHQRELDIPVWPKSLINLPFEEISDAIAAPVPAAVRQEPAWDVASRPHFGRSRGCRIDLGESGEGGWDLVQISDQLLLMITDARYQRGDPIVVQGEDLLKLRFLLEGSVLWYRREAGPERESLRHAAPRTVLSYHPEGVDVHYRPEPGRRLTMMTLNCKRELAERFFGRHILESFRNRDGLDAHEPLACSTLPLTPRVQLALNELLWSPYVGEKRFLFMQAKCTELLCLVSNAIDERFRHNNDRQVAKITLSQRDIHCLEEVRRIIEADLSVWHSLANLSRRAGLNVRKLNYGFKKLTGKTPYGYALECRMQTAYELLKAHNLPVSEVAYRVGYRHPPNFTTAFRRHFGYTPHHLRGQLPH